MDEIVTSEDYLDKEIDVAKPLPGTTEIQLYDKKTTTLSRKTVKFEKAKHKYTHFLHGCRSVLIKDTLYILGGVDQDKISTKTAFVYCIKTNELKIMKDMICPHAYHSVEFLDYYKSILVIGGENSKSCELYDLNIGLWRRLPDLNIPRAFCNLYLDKVTHAIYTFFGVVGNLTQKNNFTEKGSSTLSQSLLFKNTTNSQLSNPKPSTASHYLRRDLEWKTNREDFCLA